MTTHIPVLELPKTSNTGGYTKNGSGHINTTATTAKTQTDKKIDTLHIHI